MQSEIRELLYSEMSGDHSSAIGGTEKTAQRRTEETFTCCIQKQAETRPEKDSERYEGIKKADDQVRFFNRQKLYFIPSRISLRSFCCRCHSTIRYCKSRKKVQRYPG